MKERIKQIRKLLPEYGKTQESFAKYLGISKQNLSSYETGRRTPSDAVIQLICQKCNIKEEWLRNGTGEVYQYTNIDNYSEIVTIIGEKDPKARQAIINYWNLSEEDKKLFWQWADKFLKTDSEIKETNNDYSAAEQIKEKNESPQEVSLPILNAAHADNYMEASEELKIQEEDIMDSEDF